MHHSSYQIIKRLQLQVKELEQSLMRRLREQSYDDEDTVVNAPKPYVTVKGDGVSARVI